MRISFRASAAAVVTVGASVVGTRATAAVVTDDFNDNTRAALWSQVEDNAVNLSVTETSNRLEGRSNGGGPSTLDAIYLSNGPAGFSVSALSDFSLKIDYDAAVASMTKTSTSGAIALDLGLGTDAGGADSLTVAFGQAYVGPVNVSSLVFASRTDDVDTITQQPGVPASGTLYISYDAALDAVYLSDAGYGAANADQTYTGLVQGTWNATDLLVAFGLRGSGYALDAGDAFLDNFELTTGEVTFVPEPGIATLAAVVALLLARRRRPLGA
jgi:hypothetical protein